MGFGYFGPLDPTEPLSNRFTLADLTVTNSGLPNMPEADSQEYTNLKWLAGVLDELWDSIGPFQIISGFRSPELQEKLRAAGEPTAAKRSFHEAGMAVDIYPSNMSIDEFFGKILASDWKEKLGEISIKPTQNTLHLSLPTEKTQGVIMALNQAGAYVRLTAEEIADYAAPYLEAAVEMVSEVAKKPATKIAFVALIGGAILFLLTLGRKKHA